MTLPRSRLIKLRKKRDAAKARLKAADKAFLKEIGKVEYPRKGQAR